MGEIRTERDNGNVATRVLVIDDEVLLLRATGRRPGKRAMEMIRFYLLGYASLEELTRELGLDKKAA